MAGLFHQTLARRIAVWLMALTLAVSIAAGASHRTVSPMSFVDISGFPVRAWVEKDGPDALPRGGIYVSFRFLGLRFVLEWSDFNPHSS
jgi:hypothetical protein